MSMRSYYIRVNLESWKAGKLDRTNGDVKICSRKSIENFIKGSLILIISNKQKNLSKIMLKMRELGYIQNQNILKRSTNTNKLEVEYMFTCRKEIILSTDSLLECGQFDYDDSKEVVVDGVHFLVIFKGVVSCTGITEDEARLLCSRNQYLSIGRFLMSEIGDSPTVKEKSK